jgi:2-isopropylmalate synthase
VPYLPIDPADVGRTYEGVIRINSQSGKGGLAYILEQEYALDLPRTLQIEFREIILEVADRTGKELLPDDLWQAFETHYLQPEGCAVLLSYRDEPMAGTQRQQRQVSAALNHNNRETMVHGQGSGPLEAFVNAMASYLGLPLQIVDYRQHAIGPGADARAAAYVQLNVDNSVTRYGVGIDGDVMAAAFRAVLSALARATPLLRQDAGQLKRSGAVPGA